MRRQDWFLFLMLSFGFLTVLAESSEERPPYIGPKEFGRKREAKDGFMVHKKYDNS